MSQLDLARLQFAMTSIYHFLFVPVTIGLAFLTALLQTSWYRSGRDEYLRLTRFFGTLLVINIAVGVVTGLVQEFQFGMDWSTYSRTVGDVFGAPLAMEGLAAFFLESTFLGLWLFGWDKLSRRVHLATIWAVALGAALSAAFIMAANSWMQHPVGYTIDPSTGRPQLSNICAVMTNPVFLRGYLHVLLASLITGVGRHARRCGLAAAPGLGSGRLPPGRAARPGRPHPERPPGHDRRQRAGRDRGDVPADEDRGLRGAVGDLPAVLVLAVPDRRRQRRPHAGEDHPDPAPAVAAGDQLVERPGPGPQPGAGAVREPVRAGELRAERLRPVLVDAGDGLHRGAALPGGRCGGCGASAATGSTARPASCAWPSGRRCSRS